ncbi:MAG: hypothetical protein J6A75_11075 [Lachnospiraceae bacterium]|nr:hypothetical protein [Lachnospiraceae bacterium]
MSVKMLPSEVIECFLNTIREWETEYQMSFDVVGTEDKRLQDLLHEIELSKNAKEKNRAATKLKNSRKMRRENKDKVLMLESIVKFFEEPQNRKVLKQMEQLLGRQRKQEKMLLSERIYKPRVGGE